MPVPRLSKILAWSYSRLGAYTQCPKKAKFLYVDKLKEPDSPAGMKGTRVHAIAAMVATGRVPILDRDNVAFHSELPGILKSKKFPPELETFKEEFRALKKVSPIVEAEWAFDKDWEPCSWFGPEAWLRIKVDLHYVVPRSKLNGTRVVIRDHKTGRWSADHALQRELYALGAFLHYPDAAECEASHWYLDAGKAEPDPPKVWLRADLEKLKKAWLARTKAMLNDTSYVARPSDKCRWCHFSKAKGGPCPAA